MLHDTRKMAMANIVQAVVDVRDRVAKYINQSAQERVKATAEGTLYGFLIKHSLVMKITGFCLLLVGFWNPFWYDTGYNGFSTSDKKHASGNDLNRFYNTGKWQ